MDLATPASRREALRRIDPDDPRPHHLVLREIFDLERAWREGAQEGDGDEFEHVYVAAFLLFLIGDPADAPRLSAATFRTGDMDLGIGFDVEAVFGTGPRRTLAWLHENGRLEEHAHLTAWLAQQEDPGIDAWARRTRDYFCSPQGDLLLGTPG